MITPAGNKPSAEPKFPKDHDRPGGGTGGGRTPLIEYFYSAWTNYVYPSRTSGVTWHQNSPYNYRVSQKLGSEVLAGCVPVGVAQLCACWEYPNQFKGHFFDWNLMKSQEVDFIDDYNDRSLKVSDFLLMISSSDMVDVSFGSSGSGADCKKIPKVLKALGFTEWGGRRGYSETDINNELMNGYPIIFSGYSHKNFLGIQDGGHVWLVDRLMERTRIKTLLKNGIPVSDTTESEYLVYCNWGWGNSKSGYFYHKVFDSNNKPSVTRSDKNGYYKYELRTYIGIRR